MERTPILTRGSAVGASQEVVVHAPIEGEVIPQRDETAARDSLSAFRQLPKGRVPSRVVLLLDREGPLAPGDIAQKVGRSGTPASVRLASQAAVWYKLFRTNSYPRIAEMLQGRWAV